MQSIFAAVTVHIPGMALDGYGGTTSQELHAPIGRGTIPDPALLKLCARVIVKRRIIVSRSYIAIESCTERGIKLKVEPSSPAI